MKKKGMMLREMFAIMAIFWTLVIASAISVATLIIRWQKVDVVAMVSGFIIGFTTGIIALTFVWYCITEE